LFKNEIIGKYNPKKKGFKNNNDVEAVKDQLNERNSENFDIEASVRIVLVKGMESVTMSL